MTSRSVLPGGDGNDRVSLRERARRPGWRMLVTLIVLGAGIATVVVRGNTTSNPPHAVMRTQVTALMQIRGADGTAVGSLLLAHDPTNGRGVELLVPARLISDVCGFGAQDFGALLALPDGTALSRRVLTATLDGLRIDGSWVLSTPTLSRLVNQVGGITVKVAGGERHLSGAQAAAYTASAGSGQSGGPASLARLQAVVDATIRALPSTAAKVAAVIGKLGATTSGIGPRRLAGLLTGLAASDRVGGAVLPTDLPVTSIDAGAGATSYVANAPAITQLVKSQLAASLPVGAGPSGASVLVLNGVGHPGLLASACPKLTKGGFTFAGGGNAATFNYRKSIVEIFSASDVALGRRVATTLGLPRSDVRRGSLNQNVARVVVIIGRDYKR